MAAGGVDGGGEMGRKKHGPIRIDTHTLLYIALITNKNILHNTGNLAQYSVRTVREKILNKSEYLYTHN